MTDNKSNESPAGGMVWVSANEFLADVESAIHGAGVKRQLTIQLVAVARRQLTPKSYSVLCRVVLALRVLYVRVWSIDGQVEPCGSEQGIGIDRGLKPLCRLGP